MYAGTWIETSRHLNLISLTSRKSWGDQPERAPPCLAAPSLPTAAQNELHPSISFQTAKSLLLPASKFLLAPSPRPTTTSPRLLGSRLERAGLPFPFSWSWTCFSPPRSLGGVSCSWLRYLVALGRRMDVWSARGGGRLGRHSPFLGRVVVVGLGFPSGGRNDGANGVLLPSVDGSDSGACSRRGSSVASRQCRSVSQSVLTAKLSVVRFIHKLAADSLNCYYCCY